MIEKAFVFVAASEFEADHKNKRLITVKYELLFVGPITILYLHCRLAKSSFKLLLDR